MYRDTNFILVAALVAVKLHIQICYVGAGIRIYSASNQEEINRVYAAHISSLLFANNCRQAERSV